MTRSPRPSGCGLPFSVKLLGAFYVDLGESICGGETTYIINLSKAILEFRNARDWKQIHTPENLAKSISIEAAELLEHFQWGDDYSVDELSDELADILIYSFLMANAVGVDIEEIMLKKLERNKNRFPVEKVKGNSGKNTRVDMDE